MAAVTPREGIGGETVGSALLNAPEVAGRAYPTGQGTSVLSGRHVGRDVRR